MMTTTRQAFTFLGMMGCIALAACSGGDDFTMAPGAGTPDDEASVGADDDATDEDPATPDEGTGGSAGGADDGAGGTADEMPEGLAGGPPIDDEVDDAPVDPATTPKVVTTTPSTGQKGVEETAKIVLTFDEPMDQFSVEEAYQSEKLPRGEVDFSWNGSSDVLTISPQFGLDYAEVGPDGDALTYTVRLLGSATDAEGDPLGSDFAVSFSTLRRVSQTMPMIETMSGHGSSASSHGPALKAGDSAIKVTTRALLSFDLGDVPADVEVEAATLTVGYGDSFGAPSDLGDLKLHDVMFFQRSEGYGAEIVAGLNWTKLLAVFPNKGGITADATARVADDLANRDVRSDRTQFRLQFPTLTNDDATGDVQEFDADPGKTKLRVTYLAE